MPKIVLFQPEIAGNVGSIIRTCLCFNCELHIIEPCGFPFDIRRIKKSALDYFEKVVIIRHQSFDDFTIQNLEQSGSRLVLVSTKGSTDYRNFKFQESDYLLFGKESGGVPSEVIQKADEKVTIPMKNDARSLNLAVACGIIIARANS